MWAVYYYNHPQLGNEADDIERWISENKTDGHRLLLITSGIKWKED